MSSSKRANGEGSIYPYRNGFAAYAWVETPEGMRKRKYVYGKTRDVVHTKWLNLLRRAATRPIATLTPRLREYLAYWLDQVVRTTLKPKTAETYATHVRLHIVPGLGEKRLESSRSATSGGGSTSWASSVNVAPRARTPRAPQSCSVAAPSACAAANTCLAAR